MGTGNKPKPPPLDDEAAIVNAGGTDAAHAESGKATAEDAARANADALREARDADAARREAEALEAEATLEAEAEAARQRRQQRQQRREKPTAQIIQRSDQFVARPDPSRPISATDDLVLGNWVGRYVGPDGQACPALVKHGTPIEALPRDLADAIRETRGQRVGPLPPRQPPNPFTP